MSLRDRNSNRISLDSSTALFAKNNLKVRRFGNVEEVLGVAAPELIFLSAFVNHTTTSGCTLVPSACVDNFVRSRQLHQVDLFGGKNAQKERSRVIILDMISFNVWHNNVVAGLLVMRGLQPDRGRNFALAKPLEALGSLQHDILLVNFPKTVSFGANSHNEEVDWNVRFLRNIFIFLHERNDDLRFLGHTQSILRIVEPLLVRVLLHVVCQRVLGFFFAVEEHWHGTSTSDSLPLAMDGELSPGGRENFAHVHLVVVGFPIFEVHPPVAVILELVV